MLLLIVFGCGIFIRFIVEFPSVIVDLSSDLLWNFRQIYCRSYIRFIVEFPSDLFIVEVTSDSLWNFRQIYCGSYV